MNRVHVLEKLRSAYPAYRVWAENEPGGQTRFYARDDKAGVQHSFAPSDSWLTAIKERTTSPEEASEFIASAVKNAFGPI